MCSALLLVEPAKGKVAAASLGLSGGPRSLWHWAGFQQSGRNDSGPEQVEEAALLLS